MNQTMLISSIHWPIPKFLTWIFLSSTQSRSSESSLTNWKLACRRRRAEVNDRMLRLWHRMYDIMEHRLTVSISCKINGPAKNITQFTVAQSTLGSAVTLIHDLVPLGQPSRCPQSWPLSVAVVYALGLSYFLSENCICLHTLPCLHADSRSTQPSTLCWTVKCVPAKGWWCSATGKVTAGLTESNGSLPPSGWLIVTCGLPACTPGSARGPTLGNEYGKPLPFTCMQMSDKATGVSCMCQMQLMSVRRGLWPKEISHFTKRQYWNPFSKCLS